MSEKISGHWPRFIYNGLLLGSAGYALYQIHPAQHPCACAACWVGGLAALIGLCRVYLGSGEPNEWRRVRDVYTGVLELAPLPLVNMDLYMATQGRSYIVMGHAIFVFPLLCDLSCALWKQRVDCDFSDTLRDLCMLGNIISLGFLAWMEHNWQYARLMLVMTLVKYGSLLVDSIEDGTGENFQLLGTAYFLHILHRVLCEMKGTTCFSPWWEAH